jgi:intein/homing endonuclease
MEELLKNNLGLQILTDTGWVHFDGLVNKGIKHTITIEAETSTVTLTPDHQIYINKDHKIPADQLKVGDLILTLSGLQKIISIRENKLEKVYDIVNAGLNKRFYADEILCSNCEFIIADETLINPNTLIQLEGAEPTSRMGQVRWYQKPTKGNIYVVGLDPSLGTGGDPAAIQIFEANTTTQIGEWKHNKTEIPQQIKLLAEINKYIIECTGEPNNLYYSLENNSIGEAAIISLNELGETNIPGIFFSEYGKKRKGFNTSHKIKLIACAKFKTLLESKKMKIHSRSLISELKNFVANGGSYKAKIGETDDLVMALLLVVRMLQQLTDFHQDLGTQMRDHDEFIAPLPFFAVLS